MPRRSGRVVRQPDRYMFLGESYERILDELDAEPVNYNEALQDKDAKLWKKVMKSFSPPLAWVSLPNSIPSSHLTIGDR